MLLAMAGIRFAHREAHWWGAGTVISLMNLPYLLESNVRMPRKVCIVAPGPNARGCYRRIPADAYVICVNKAALIQEVRPNMWIINHSDVDWYRQADTTCTAETRAYSEAAAQAIPGLHPRAGYYQFRPILPKFQPHEMTPLAGDIRDGATVVGHAIQLAFLLGSKEIILCGADMSGTGYWDGTVNPLQADHHGEVWNAVSRLDPMVRWLESEAGVTVSTMSETRISVRPYLDSREH
jgi:hypothetical protein